MARYVHRRFRAPQADATALVLPPIAEAKALIERNRLRLADDDGAWLWGEMPLFAVARQARRELLEVALRYTGQYRDTSFVAALNDDSSFLLAGHQPELFHPGVWFKNFLLSALGKHLGVAPINLIIDTDAVHSVGIRVPSFHDGQAHAPIIPFDAPGAAGSWEERPVVDRELFASFASRVTSVFGRQSSGGSIEPLIVHGLWELLPPKTSDARLGVALAQARHMLEASWGLQTLEAPISRVAQTPSFRRFAVYLLQDLQSFSEIYNAALAEYRQVNRIRSRTHPVPALADQYPWREAPFFIWTSTDSRRRAAFVRCQGGSFELSDREKLTVRLTASREQAVEQLAEYEAQGIKLRPRALITTMYARMFLSDAFIHGIGGAKYDELTDLIIRRYFGEPLEYITATATFRLPMERPDVTDQDVRQCADQLRSLRFRPETLVNHPLVARDSQLTSRLTTLADEKRDFLNRNYLRRCPPQVFQQLESLNRRTRELLKPVERALLARHSQLTQELAQTKLLSSREFSFGLFNSQILPARLLELCNPST